MAEVGFYIDTGAREEDVEDEEEDGGEAKDLEEEDRVLGSRDAAVEKQQRERAAKERNLASFLFGKTTDDVKEIPDDEAEEGPCAGQCAIRVSLPLQNVSVTNSCTCHSGPGVSTACPEGANKIQH